MTVSIHERKIVPGTRVICTCKKLDNVKIFSSTYTPTNSALSFKKKVGDRSQSWFSSGKARGWSSKCCAHVLLSIPVQRI